MRSSRYNKSIEGLASLGILDNQVRGLLRPFGIRVASRQGTKRFAIAVADGVKGEPVLGLAVNALLEALAAIEGQIAKLDESLLEIARRSEVCWRLMSVPGMRGKPAWRLNALQTAMSLAHRSFV